MFYLKDEPKVGYLCMCIHVGPENKEVVTSKVEIYLFQEQFCKWSKAEDLQKGICFSYDFSHSFQFTKHIYTHHLNPHKKTCHLKFIIIR